MSTTNKIGNGEAARGSVPIIAVVAAGIALAVFIFFLARHNADGAGSAGAVASAADAPPIHEGSDTAYLRQKAHECAGDMKKLSADDQLKVQKITHGNGVIVLKTMAGVH